MASIATFVYWRVLDIKIYPWTSVSAILFMSYWLYPNKSSMHGLFSINEAITLVNVYITMGNHHFLAG